MANEKKTTARAVTDAVEIDGVNNSEIERGKNKKKTDIVSEIEKKMAELDGTAIPEEWDAIIESTRIDLNKDIPLPLPLICDDDRPILTKGNLAVVTGQSGSRKTTVCVVLVAACLNIEGYGHFRNSEHVRWKVLLIDTEQARGHVARTGRRQNRIQGREERSNDPNFIILSIQEIRKETRRELVRNAIMKFRPDLCIIDVVSDLVNDINNIGEAYSIVEDFQKWARELDCNILLVIHDNPGQTKLRGHLGTVIEEKAENVIRCEPVKGADMTHCDFVKSRDKKPHEFFIKYNEKGLPEICELPQGLSETKPKKK